MSPDTISVYHALGKFQDRNRISSSQGGRKRNVGDRLPQEMSHVTCNVLRHINCFILFGTAFTPVDEATSDQSSAVAISRV